MYLLNQTPDKFADKFTSTSRCLVVFLAHTAGGLSRQTAGKQTGGGGAGGPAVCLKGEEQDGTLTNISERCKVQAPL